MKLALAGAALSALLGSLTTAVLLTDVVTLDQFRVWVVGSLSGRGADVATGVAPFVAAGALLSLGSARALDTLALGDDVLGRLVARPAEVQVGILTAVLGAPLFIALVRRRKLAEL